MTSSRQAPWDNGASSQAETLWTIGHSTRTWDGFVDMLQAAGIRVLVDVRRFPGSRRNPQFSAQALARNLPAAGVEYRSMLDLGGRRKPVPDSPNDAWRNAAFRGYADYMDTDDFAAARAQLAELATARRTAVMCAEAVWWRCHRGLISDAFKADGWNVIHLMAPGREQVHPYTSAARIVDGRLGYSAPAPSQAALPW